MLPPETGGLRFLPASLFLKSTVAPAGDCHTGRRKGRPTRSPSGSEIALPAPVIEGWRREMEYLVAKAARSTHDTPLALEDGPAVGIPGVRGCPASISTQATAPAGCGNLLWQSWSLTRCFISMERDTICWRGASCRTMCTWCSSRVPGRTCRKSSRTGKNTRLARRISGSTVPGSSGSRSRTID